ncbi:MAG TPA: flagellar export chaperone FliS [Lacipirellulaceae bacterium]|jgi:flagellar protein FliS|nr:flagellar export chaperone FliS [Lacipirellulaceae bacterium]
MQHSTYLESKVLTAPPQRLQLMLIEGAIRFARQAEDALSVGNRVVASAALMRTIDIVGELLAAARSHKSDLNKRVADLYMFLFRRVTEAKINADANALGEALRLLEFERQTWQMLCDKLSGETQDTPATHRSHAFGSNHGNAKSGFSLEA